MTKKSGGKSHRSIVWPARPLETNTVQVAILQDPAEVASKTQKDILERKRGGKRIGVYYGRSGPLKQIRCESQPSKIQLKFLPRRGATARDRDLHALRAPACSLSGNVRRRKRCREGRRSPWSKRELEKLEAIASNSRSNDPIRSGNMRSS